MKKLVELKSFKGFEHFLDHLLQILNQSLVVYFDILLRNQNVLLLYTLLFFLYDLDEELGLVIFIFYFPIAQINHLPQLSHRLTPCKYLFENVLRVLLEGRF